MTYPSRPDYSGGDEEMEREQMTEVEQFENTSKDGSCDHRYHQICL